MQKDLLGKPGGGKIYCGHLRAEEEKGPAVKVRAWGHCRATAQGYTGE